MNGSSLSIADPSEVVEEACSELRAAVDEEAGSSGEFDPVLSACNCFIKIMPSHLLQPSALLQP